jgi:hypothetical protein
MKQVLFVNAGSQFPDGMFRFLYQMRLQERIHARGLFFKPVDYSALNIISTPAGATVLQEMDGKEKEVIAGQKSKFGSLCNGHYITYDIQEKASTWDKELFVKETRFADVALISMEMFFADVNNNQPNSYLRSALHAAECPVVVIPENFTKIEHILAAYDGGEESVFAVKQFSYLFPELLQLPCEIVYAKHEEKDDIPEQKELLSFAKYRFECLSMTKLNFDAKHYFSSWIRDKQDVMLIAGSFGRSTMSYLGKDSFVKDIIHDHNIPLFICHK